MLVYWSRPVVVLPQACSDAHELSCGSDKGGRTAAALLSLIATCQRHQVEGLAYLRDVLTRIAAMPISQLDRLVPDLWPPATTPAN